MFVCLFVCLDLSLSPGENGVVYLRGTRDVPEYTMDHLVFSDIPLTDKRVRLNHVILHIKSYLSNHVFIDIKSCDPLYQIMCSFILSHVILYIKSCVHLY